MSREPWRWLVAIMLVLVLLAPAYRWAGIAALGLAVGMIAATVATLRQELGRERRERQEYEREIRQGVGKKPSI